MNDLIKIGDTVFEVLDAVKISREVLAEDVESARSLVKRAEARLAEFDVVSGTEVVEAPVEDVVTTEAPVEASAEAEVVEAPVQDESANQISVLPEVPAEEDEFAELTPAEAPATEPTQAADEFDELPVAPAPNSPRRVFPL